MKTLGFFILFVVFAVLFIVGKEAIGTKGAIIVFLSVIVFIILVSIAACLITGLPIKNLIN